MSTTRVCGFIQLNEIRYNGLLIYVAYHIPMQLSYADKISGIVHRDYAFRENMVKFLKRSQNMYL